MLNRRITSLLTATVLGMSAVVAVSGPASAADSKRLGTQSLASVLAADGSGFDRNARDFDILDNAVGAVLAAKPNSAVGVLTKGRTRLTAFAPTDGAFRRLVHDLTGTRYPREQRVFKVLAKAAGIDTIEAVLLYHVVPGKVITQRQARQADGASLATALDGAVVKVNVRRDGRVGLVDADRNDANARLIGPLKDLNKGNRQIAHGITQVLRPVNL